MITWIISILISLSIGYLIFYIYNKNRNKDPEPNSYELSCDWKLDTDVFNAKHGENDNFVDKYRKCTDEGGCSIDEIITTGPISQIVTDDNYIPSNPMEQLAVLKCGDSLYQNNENKFCSDNITGDTKSFCSDKDNTSKILYFSNDQGYRLAQNIDDHTLFKCVNMDEQLNDSSDWSNTDIPCFNTIGGRKDEDANSDAVSKCNDFIANSGIEKSCKSFS